MACGGAITAAQINLRRGESDGMIVASQVAGKAASALHQPRVIILAAGRGVVRLDVEKSCIATLSA